MCVIEGCERAAYSRGLCRAHHTPVQIRGDLAARFWSKVDKRNPDECWVFTAGGVVRSGHRMMWVDGGMRGAHRVSWELHHGPIPDGMSVCHRCDNPPCVNPAHLFLGTPTENTADRDAKGRHVALPGSDNGAAKLTEDDVREIRRMLDNRVPQRRIAQRFGVHQTLISLINVGKAWTHV